MCYQIMPGAANKCVFLVVLLAIRNTQGATPVITNPNPDGSTVISIDETTSTGTNILTVTATDADSGTLSYAITVQNPSTKFTRAGATITTSAALDFETEATYTLTVEVSTDSDASTATVQFTVNIQDINDETPVITGTFTASINEELPTGTAVSGLTITANDADSGDVLIYSLSSTADFQIDTATGAITTSRQIDYEAGISSFTLTLTVKDSANSAHSATESLIINLVDTNDNPPVFNPALMHATIPENTAQSVTVVLLTFTDDDAGSSISFNITSGDDVLEKFMFSGNAIVTSANAIDYEALGASDYKYTLVVHGDDGGNTGTVTVVVSITGENENAPAWITFSPAYTSATTPYNIIENTALGTSIVTLVATDADDGIDGEILYSITSITDDGGNPVSGLFNLDRVSGVLSTASTSFDRDTATGGVAYYDLVVRASDQGSTPQTLDRTVRVGLADYNDNTPTFAPSIYTYTMPEDTTAGSSLLPVVATDYDETSSLSYTLLGTSTPSSYSTYFEMDATNTNQINLRAVADLDTGAESSFQLYIQVTDGGLPELTSTATVIISVTTQNEHTPAFGAAQTVATDEDSAVGTTVATVAATDSDTGVDGTITYSIFSGNSDNKFTIDPNNGAVKVAATLDFETDTSYVLVIYAVDGGALAETGSTTLTVNINDKSDVTPTCTTYSFSQMVSEITAGGQTVVTLTCSDADAVDTLTYSIATGNIGSKFNISNTGVLTLDQVVDYDTGEESFSLVVHVSDGTTTLEIPVDITILPSNEDTPAFATNPTVSVAESESTATTLTTYIATDTDASPHNIVQYKKASVSNGGTNLFSIDQNSGEIKLAQPLDYETQQTYLITVEAIDGGALTGTGTVTISVTDVNDVTPSCTSMSYVVSVSENTAPNADVIPDFSCSDSDSPTLNYSITSPTPSTFFSLDLTGTPKLVVGSVLDYETTSAYQLEMRVSDGTLSATVYIDISITDVNEGGPTFSPTTYTESISESTAISTSIAKITATDLDSSSSDFGNLIYSFTSGNNDAKFSIDPSSGRVSVAGVLDADTTSSYTLTIQAIEAGGANSAAATLTVTVTDANDNTPTCSSGYAFSVTFAEEGSTGDDLYTLVCTDADGPTVTYTLTNGATYFQMNNNVLELKNSIDYDSAASTQFQVTIQVSDGLNTVDVEGSVTVTSVNEHTPMFTQATYTASHAESISPGTTIVTISATDADSDAIVTYEWVASQTVFTLDQSSGVILLAGTLDRETTSSYNLLVRASDGTNTATATVDITVTDVNDNAPVFVANSYSGTVVENAAIGPVLTVVASDNDAAANNFGTVTYRIASGDAGVFSIDTGTGILSTSSTLDYETATSYTIYIEAYDSNSGAGALTSTVVATVTVTAVNEFDPSFTNTGFTGSAAENAAIGLNLLKVSATDADDGADGEVTYSMTNHAYFYLNTATGEIFIKQTLDYETDTSHTFQVVAQDTGASARSAATNVTVTVIDVNDQTPTCNPVLQTVSFQEVATTTSTSIATLTCSDIDTVSSLAYSFSSINGAPSDGTFSIDMSTGEITLAMLLDYETVSSYSILVLVSDGSLSSTATVEVTVTDYNEADPVFNPATYATSISETTPIGSFVIAVTATDADTANTVTYSISTASIPFTIDQNNGQIVTSSSIDFDTLANPKEYELVVLAIDDGSSPNARTATVTATVTISDNEDITPIFNPGVYTAEISENDIAGTTVVTVTATDSEGTNSTYSLANDFTIFQVNANGDIVIQTKNQDYESGTTSYALVVYAADSGGNTGTTTVHVTITSYNEHTPVLSAAGETVNITENAAVGTTVVNVDATDTDSGNDGVITYSISASPAGHATTLAIVPTTGVVTVAGVIDMETVTNPLTFTIDAVDGGTSPGALTAQFTLTVTVVDDNDNTPSCPTSLYTASVAEDIAAMDTVTTIACTDSDTDSPNNVVSYRIASGNGDNKFSIDTSSGVVTIGVGQMLDRETTASYLLVVEAFDGGTSSLTTSTTLTITVTDVNDNDPTFPPGGYSFTVAESVALSTTIGTVAATDADTGQAATLVYSIQNGNIDNNIAVDSSTGELKVIGAFNYELADMYNLEVIAVDNLATIRTGTTQVAISVTDVNDITPSCLPVLQTVQFGEDTLVNALIATVTCSDTDTGVNGDVSHTIATVDNVATTTPFSIVTATGAISVASLLDFETDTSKTIVVHGIDGGGLTGSATVVVVITAVNEHNPSFTSTPYSQTIAENTTVGSSVFQVTATDNDDTDTITYSINPASTVFNINPADGTMNLIDTLDFETTSSYEVIVVATDSGSLTDTATVTISISDLNDGVPVFNPAVYIASIAENDIVETTVTTVTATDAEMTAPTYTLFSGNGDGVFRIEPSGAVIIDDVGNLDYDSATKSYTLVVQASDGTNVGSATVAVTVTNYNDNTPSFAMTSSSKDFSENTAVGTNIVTVVATDGDHGDDGLITYSISGGNVAQKFAINPSLGDVTLAGSLDMEDTQTYVLTIDATDSGTNPSALTAQYTLTVNVLDVNDVTPLCTKSLYSANVAEDTVMTTSVLQLTCTDADQTNPNNVIGTYNIVSGNTGAAFAVTALGEVQVNNALDRETLDSYTLVIDVIDNGGSPLTTTTTVAVTITDVNDNTPGPGMDPYGFTVAEDSSTNSLVGTVSFSDTDQGNAGVVTYTINSGNVDNKLDIDSSTGEIKIKAALDYETATANPYVLEVYGTDNDASSPRTGSTTVSITVSDSNDNTPSCTPTFQTVSFAEDTAASTTIDTLTCTDADGTPANNALTYTIDLVNGMATTVPFSVDASGVLTLAAAQSFDFESTPSYRVLIGIRDSGGTSLSSTATVHVVITDVNEAAPVFQSTPYTVNVAESTGVGTNVFVITAIDTTDTSNTVTYAINPSNAYFEVGPISGIVYTVDIIDYDNLGTNPIPLTVVATDSGTPPMSTSDTLTITITNDPDGIPTFNPGVYTATLAENAAVETTVVTVNVTDIDDSSWTMSFASGNSDNVFRIDANGDIVVNDRTNLNYDSAVKSYVLMARAVDAGSNTGTATVVIQVTNINNHTPTLTANTNAENIAENSALGTSVDDVDANDMDHGDDGVITYSINSVTNSGDGLFNIDPSSGLVTVSGTLDRETANTYVLTISATDGGTNPGPLAATYTLTVTVTDENDHTPSCTATLYTGSVAEDAMTATSVAQLTCSDGDAEANNNVINTYTITSGGTDFSVSTSGEITTSTALDRETTDNYQLIITVADSGSPALTFTTTVTIFVTDVNDNSPIFAPASYNFNYAENVAVGTTLGTVTATDLDIGSAGAIVFSIFSGDDDSKFKLDESTGDLILNGALDFETASSNPYTLTIHAVDSDASPLTGTGTIIVTVTDFNDNAPACTPLVVSASHIESTTAGSPMATLTCPDADDGVNDDLTFTILSVNGVASSQFAVNGIGVITLSTPLDYESTTLHTLLVEVKDGGAISLSTTVSVNIHVTDDNDNSPVFSNTPYQTNVIENTAIGTTVFTVTASDADVDNAITFSLNPTSNEFQIDPSSGDLILILTLDYDTVPNTYLLSVEAKDDGASPLTSTVTVSITVTNFNDGTPEFNPGVYATTVSENAANLHTVLIVTITDSDTLDTTFTYNILTGNTHNIFDIAGTTKTPSLRILDNTLLDYETTQSYSLVITVSDGTNMGSATVGIQVTGVNEHDPVLTPTASTQNVTENSAIGTAVVNVVASDADSGDDGSLTYSIISGDSGKFSIDPGSGMVTVAGDLDMETTTAYTVMIQVTDGGTNPSARSATYTLSVDVTDANDVTPRCSSSRYSANIAEDAAAGTTVAQLVCTDADANSPNNAITNYNPISGNGGGEFLISASGEVTTAAVTFDRETTASYELVIEVSDSGVPSLTTTTTLAITITDVNDNDPQFGLPVYNIMIDETTAVHTSIGQVAATDDDIDLAGSIVFSIFSGNGDGKFAIDRTVGDITLAASVDYETTTTTPYVLEIHATDREAAFRTGTATVSITLNDINDNTPSCTASLYSASIAEDSGTGTSVVTVTCSDRDAISTVTYSLTSTVFSIGSTTGQIDTINTLDIETTASYDLTVTASDNTLSTDVTVTVTITNVNDHTPAFNPAGPYTVNINETEAVGYTVYDIDATDGDVSATTFIYAIAGGDTNSVFTIGATSGIIQQQKSIDRDDPLNVAYTLTITVADGTGTGALTATTSIVIIIDDLNDNSPSCDASAYYTTVSEQALAGSPVITPTCSDLDVVASPTLAYSITNGNGEVKFLINSGSGAVTLQANLDYETTTSYTLTVTVDDQGTSALITTIYMTVYVDPVNENAPVFQGEPYDTTISESEAVGYQVVRVSATDTDDGSTHGDVRFAITGGNAAGHFSIDASTGWVTVAASLDRESTTSYPLVVEASDMLSTDVSARTATSGIVVTIQDVNDNYPQINPATYAETVNENSVAPTSIVQIMATDDDEGNAGTDGLVYSITSGNTGNVFSMNGSWFVLVGNIDAATLANYVLSVRVEDQGVPALSSTTVVSISVTAINEHAPNFTVTDDTVTVSESETVGNSLYRVAASDADTGDFGTLRFYLKSGNSDNEFSVDLFIGDVRVANSLDYDTLPNVYTLVIEVEDTASSNAATLTSTFTLTVSLIDFNDENPIFTMNTYSGAVDENVATSTSVLTVTANDADTGTNSAITYTIISGTGAATFTIDSSTGVVSTSASIDHETDTSYDLTVTAVDGGIPSLSASCLVRISVNDLNDETPVFTVSSVAVTIPESTSIGSTVATAAATDADSATNNNNVITYAFSTTSALFAIASSTGEITTTNVLDRDTTARHTLTIYAVDGGSPINTATATYTVVLSDINDNDPVISGQPYDATFSEDTPQNTVIFTITATDPDIYDNAFLIYSINSGDTNSEFFIDSGSGLIQVIKSLDRETTALYNLEIQVVDSGTPARSAIVSATVTVGDINDNSPIFQPAPITTYNFSVVENVPIGTSVNQVSATDLDTGINAAIQYVVAQYITGDATHFSLDSSTGVITTAAELDRETQDTYSFIVRASDGGTSVLTSNVTVSITVTDFNDNIPSFSQTLYTATTAENQTAGTSILTVVITDIDIDVNDDITLSIDTSTTAGTRADQYIALDSATSILSVKLTIDRETDQSFNFILIATDGGTPPLSFTTNIEITVGDINDNNPVFAQTFYNAEIPYDDNCQVTATTLSATDADDGVNAVLSYTFTQNNNPHLFTLNSNTGAITIVATPVTDTGYTMYASATDGGSPALSTVPGATIRVDTYTPTERVLNYYMNISEATYLAAEATFLSQLTTVYQVNYPTAQAKRWCTAAITASSSVTRIYVIKDNTTDDVNNLTTDKEFLTVDQAYAITAADDAGTPASVITGVAWTSFVITRVEKYQYIAPSASEESKPWAETTTGIAVLAVASVAGVAGLAAAAGFAFYKFRELHKPNRVEIAGDDGGDKIAKRQYYPKKGQMQTSQLDKPYNKAKPPPTVVSLPMPSATKKVPMQINKPNPGPTDFREFNLLSPVHKDGPTLMKSPPKLRPSSPIQTNTVSMPKPLEPISRHLGKPPAYTPREAAYLNDPLSSGPNGGGNQTYGITNREFNGRALDPLTGREYEFNTRTNERRWIDNVSTNSIRPTLTRDPP